MLAAALLLAQADTSPYSRAAILSSVRQAAAGKPFTVAVKIDLDPRWHTYWSNPGDAGSPTTVEWKLPPGWKVSAPQYPSPHRIVTGDIVSYGYEQSVMLFYTITPPANAKTTTLKADAQWLVCQETCIPASASLTLRVPIAKTPTINSIDLEASRSKLPRVDKDWEVTAWSTSTGYSLRATNAPLSLNPETAYFFPFEPGVLNHGAPQTFRRTSAGLEADFAKSPYASGKAKRLRGVLVLYEGGPALLVDVPVKEKE